MIAQLEKLLDPVRRRITNLVSRGVIRSANDSGGVQVVQLSLLNKEIRDGVERPQQYGFTSVPLPGSEAFVVFAGGNRSHGFVVGTNNRAARKKELQPGEVAIYTDQGDEVYIRRGGIIEIKAATELRVTAPLSRFSGNVQIAGALNVTGAIKSDTSVADPTSTMQAMRITYNGHVHIENNSPASPTNATTQVM